MTAKDLIKSFFTKSGGLFISPKGTRVYQQDRIIYNSFGEKMYIRFSSIDYRR